MTFLHEVKWSSIKRRHQTKYIGLTVTCYTQLPKCALTSSWMFNRAKNEFISMRIMLGDNSHLLL